MDHQSGPIHRQRPKPGPPAVPFRRRKSGRDQEKGLTYIYDQAMRVNTSTRMYLAMKRYISEHPAKQFILTQPKPSEAFMFAHHAVSYNTRAQVLRYGYHSTMQALREEFAYYKDCLNRNQIEVTLDKFKEP